MIQEPQLKRWKLRNGIKCVAASIPNTSLACLDLWCRAGSSFEKDEEQGLAHFLEHMIFKGSKKLKEGEFDLKIESLGGSSNAATGFDDVHYYVLVPSEVLEQALELLINLVLQPALNEQAFSLEREVVIEEIAQQNDQPDENIFQMVLENCWENHSYGNPILGHIETLKNTEPDKMKSFHKRQYQPENIVLSIAGAIPNKLPELLQSSEVANVNKNTQLDDLPKKDEKLVFHIGRKEVKVNRLESGRIIMAWPIPPAKDQTKVLGYDIATSLLGEGRRSRLVYHLREKLQLVESVDIDVTSLEQGGLVLLEICCIEANLVKVENETNKILKSTLTEVPTEQEVKRAHQLIKSAICFGLEAPSQVAAIAGSQLLWGRNEGLLDPLKDIPKWTGYMLQKRIFPKLQPENSFTLIAKPLKEIK